LQSALAGAVFVRAERCGHNPHWEDPALVAKTIVEAFEV
ncbi:alpha/beta hydrolase, partial [Mesorhizobium sp. M7A.F.Ca.CA.003.01.2.1]